MSQIDSEKREFAPKRILCVHQGGELYGSDRSFLQAVSALREQFPTAKIDVILAADGPLAESLRRVCDEVRVRDLVVLRLASLAMTLFKCTVGLPYYVTRAYWEGRTADLIYVNTSVIADFMIAARLAPHRHILHVREIPKPKIMPFIRGLCHFSKAMILYNSMATAESFSLSPNQRQAVIHNGSDPAEQIPPMDLPAHFSPERPLRLSLLGRINNWKGQDLLVEAISLLTKDQRAKVRLRIVGGVYGGTTELKEALEQQIKKADLCEFVRVEPFKDDPGEVYAWSDVSVVPSRLPEPFGRVAIEAMSLGRPVIAARHGGLVEIVQHGQSGWLFTPNDPQALASTIQDILQEPETIRRFGVGALDRFSDNFSTQAMSEKLRAQVSQWMHLN